MGRVVALMDDLFFQMKLAETAKHLGIEVKMATHCKRCSNRRRDWSS